MNDQHIQLFIVVLDFFHVLPLMKQLDLQRCILILESECPFLELLLSLGHGFQLALELNILRGEGVDLEVELDEDLLPLLLVLGVVVARMVLAALLALLHETQMLLFKLHLLLVPNLIPQVLHLRIAG